MLSLPSAMSPPLDQSKTNSGILLISVLPDYRRQIPLRFRKKPSRMYPVQSRPLRLGLATIFKEDPFFEGSVGRRARS